MTLPEARRMWERAMDNVRERAARCVTHHAGCDCREYAHAREVAELLEVARAVVADNGPLVQDSEYLTYSCGLCGASPERWTDWKRESVIHTPDCPVMKARELVARYGRDAAEGDGP